eukprot:gene6403-biopygen13661
MSAVRAGGFLFLWIVGTLAIHPAPTFVVDLDKPAIQRWSGAVRSVVNRHGWEHSFGPVFASHNASLYSYAIRF